MKGGVRRTAYLLLDPYPCRGICRPELCRRMWARLVAASCSRRSALAGGGVHFPDGVIDGIALVPVEQGAGRSSSFSKAGRPRSARPTATSSERAAWRADT